MISTKYKEYDDARLVSLCVRGDAEAWETLITRYRRLIYSIPVRFGFQGSDSADVFQTVCVKLLEHLPQLKDESKLSGWLITITTRQCLLVRSQRAREILRTDDDAEPMDPADDLESAKAHAEEQQTVRDAVTHLPHRCRQLLELLYFDSRSPSYEEISRILSIPTPSIGPTRARCLDKLRTALRRRGIK